MTDKTTVEIQRTQRADLPSLPNYISFEDGTKIDVADLSPGELKQIAQAWTEELIFHATRRRNRSSTESKSRR